MNRSPYPQEGVELARRILTDTSFVTSIARVERDRLCKQAIQLLQNDRNARLGLDGISQEGHSAAIIPLAPFRAARLTRHTRPRLVVSPAPGGAA